MILQESFIVFSVCQGKPTDMLCTDCLKDNLTISGISFIVSHGVYNGITEQSIIISTRYEELIRRLCIDSKQECYLKVDCDSSCYLVDPRTTKETYIGIWKEVSKPNGDCTYIPSTGKYYEVW